MASPFPNTIQRIGQTIFESSPSAIQHIIGTTHRETINQYCKFKTWYLCGRHYDAPIRPRQIYYISPDEITKVPITKPPGSTFIADVRGGDWDINTKSFSETQLYESFDMVFNEGVDWEKTPWYTHAMEKISQGKTWKGYSTESGIKCRLDMLDNLYQHIQQNGLQPNKAIQNSQNHIAGLQKHESYYWPSDEVTVDVGREGQFLFYKGYTRISLSQLADVNRIPVRIRVRHEYWQEHRDEVMNNNAEPKSDQHPDLDFRESK